jgi:predicted oxidoreductase
MKTLFSPIAAGTMTWGAWGKNHDTKKISGLINVCLENGITTFDHADIYGGYTTEADFGKGFAESGIDRKDIVLISKCGIQYPSENRKVPIKHYDYSKQHILWSVENSLRNLRTDYLDVLLLHRPSPLMEPGEIAETVSELKRDGKIVDFGVSNFTASQMDLLKKDVDISVNQICFSLTQWEPMTDGSLDHMQLNGIRPMAWSPLGKVYKEDNEQTLRVKKLLAALAVKYHVPAEHILLAWILKHPAGIIPVCGTATPERIKALTKAAEIALDLEDWFSLWVESRGNKVP